MKKVENQSVEVPKKDYTELVYFFWMYFGVVVISYLLTKSIVLGEDLPNYSLLPVLGLYITFTIWWQKR